MANGYILGTSVAMDLDQSDKTWKKGLTWALLEALATNNATSVALATTPEQWKKVPTGPHGECYIGAPWDMTKLPKYDSYVDALRHFAEMHFAATLYGYTEFYHGLYHNVSQIMSNNPTAHRDVVARADAMALEAAHDACIAWEKRCREEYEEHGDIWHQIFPDYPLITFSMCDLDKADRCDESPIPFQRHTKTWCEKHGVDWFAQMRGYDRRNYIE